MNREDLIKSDGGNSVPHRFVDVTDLIKSPVYFLFVEDRENNFRNSMFLFVQLFFIARIVD